MEVEKLSLKDIETYRRAFNSYDRNHDNRISCKELEYVLRNAGYPSTPQSISEVMKYYDKNEFSEFIDLMRRRDTFDEQSRLLQAFKVFDKDGNNKIDLKELKYALENIGLKLTNEEVEHMFKIADTDRNGLVDYTEFTNLLYDIN